MSVNCEINLNKTGSYHGGDEVSGIIRYALDEPMVTDSITVSLKGGGLLKIQRRHRNRTRRYTSREVYVDIDKIMQGHSTIEAGQHEIQFKFKLPDKIPPTFNYIKYYTVHPIICKIKYYIRMKIYRPGLLHLTKHFRKEINVVSTLTPTLPMEPAMYGARSKLFQLCSSKTSTVIMKANILNSVIPIGGTIEIQSEIENDTNIIIKNVEVKLLEVLKIKVKGNSALKFYDQIQICESKTGSIQSGATQVIPINVVVPSDKTTIQHSAMVSRDYTFRITANLPCFHGPVVLEVPVQIGDLQKEELNDGLPSYWEAMGEAEKHNSSDEDDQ
ncbi:unnamed protein product [Spodoptera littoralis]|uniref:Arrestin C-terminal-like domain-containing protein n=1 Tax=Spodoptera littoralis TaxID=7109 RepID=A0A9P0N661_SPOLI|nr:unnamed protein product [Spodoptera littoralis]CAH1646448.1 unnamed protein product [Spodoptera littoralis]